MSVGEDPGRCRALATRREPPRRPAADAELPFTRQKPVRWFSPSVLSKAGLRVVLSLVFGVYLDKRELQAAIEAQPLDEHRGDPELWIDYVSDTGDGFAATYTIAWLVAQPELRVRGLDRALPRASVLVMGGDEVYPLADATAYEDRLVGPYEAALPWTDEAHPDLLALPGNHDWYDGLTSFIRIFCQKKWIGGWRTCQQRSYFAVPLPQEWWLWGIDIQLDAYIDEAQMRYFEAQAERLRPGDRIILCTAKPCWVDIPGEPAAYRNLAYLERTLIRPRGARLMLTLSGDSHHYAHYEGEDGTHKITAGGGGAFLHPTHDLPKELSIPVDDSRDGASQRYTRRWCVPDARTSRLLALRAIGLPIANPSFMLVPAALHTLLLWANQFAIRALETGVERPLAEVAVGFGPRDLALGLFRSPISVLLILAFVGALVGFAKPPARWQGWRRVLAKSVMGLAHAALQLGAVLIVALASIRLVSSFAGGGWFVFWLFVVVAALGGVAGGVIMGLYLTVCTLFPGLEAHGNEAFSSIRLTRHKNFLRLHIDDEGVLRVYPLGLRRVRKRWRFDPAGTLNPTATDHPPWLGSKGNPPEPLLIEEPIVIDGRA